MWKQGVTLFAPVSGVPACCIPPHDDVNFISRPSQNFLVDVFGVLHILYNVSLSAASTVALNENRAFLFCTVLKLNALIWRWYTFLCLEAQTLAKKQSSFKIFFITQWYNRVCDIIYDVTRVSIQTSGSQMGATCLSKGGFFNSWEEICSRQEWGGEAVDEKNLNFHYLFIQHKNCTTRLV